MDEIATLTHAIKKAFPEICSLGTLHCPVPPLSLAPLISGPRKQALESSADKQLPSSNDTNTRHLPNPANTLNPHLQGNKQSKVYTRTSDQITTYFTQLQIKIHFFLGQIKVIAEQETELRVSVLSHNCGPCSSVEQKNSQALFFLSLRATLRSTQKQTNKQWCGMSVYCSVCPNEHGCFEGTRCVPLFLSPITAFPRFLCPRVSPFFVLSHHTEFFE